MRRSVVLGEWLDRPIEADLAVAVEADRLGYGEVWIGEMAKLDAAAMAATIVARTTQIEPVPRPARRDGPLAGADRPRRLDRGGGRRTTHVALGTSSVMVAAWHGRSRRGRSVGLLAAATAEVRALLDGGRVNGFRLRQPPAGATLTVAAFGPRAVDDRRRRRPDGAQPGHRRRRRPARPAAPQHRRPGCRRPSTRPPQERRWLALGLVGYLGAAGYAEMFAEAGHADLVDFARTRPHPKDLAAGCPTA